MSSRHPTRLWITAVALIAAALPARAQYPGQIVNTGKNTSTLRAVAVLEWSGDEAHPKASRLIPVCIYDGQDLEDAGVYLARPEPIALESAVEYQILVDGKPVGIFDVDSAGRQMDSWVGFGKWKPLPKPRPAPVQVAKVDEDDTQSDVPILHRKHHPADSGAGDSGGGGNSGSDAGAQAPAPDTDRPTLHKSPDASGGSSAGSSSGNTGDTGTSSSGSTQPSDPDRPTLHRSPDNSSSTASGSGSDRPKLKKKDEENEAYVEDVATLADPGRPHLFRGKSSGYGAPVLPSLIGLPPDMHQEVAVSDQTSRPQHLWDYSWANPDDQDKMKAAMEDLARTALGLNPPPVPVAKPAPKTTSSRKSAKPAPPPPAPAPLLDEQFRVFELAYGSGATMVLSAHTAGSGAQEKFVTLVAQPDLYGNVAVLLKNVTDAAHLDDTPRMRLVDAVDAMADNRGDLLFELRGATQRQFALYRVLRGDATRIFLSGADAIAATAGN